MKFTVLLSLYNKESAEYLRDCLKSIQFNTLKPDQVVIVFDGPVGSALEKIVNGFQRSLPIDIVALESNVGLGMALNRGLEACRNEIVFRMDTDDICLPNRFEKQSKFMAENPEVVLLGSAIEEYDEKMDVCLGIRFSVIEHVHIVSYSKKRNPFNHMSVVFKKSAIEAVGGYQHHLFMEDYNLWLRILSAGYVTHNLKEVLVHVRAGDSMINRRNGISYISSEMKLARMKYDLKIDKWYGVLKNFIIRTVPRLLPPFLLKYVYGALRR